MHTSFSVCVCVCVDAIVHGVKMVTPSDSEFDLQGFAESLQHCIKPQISVNALYGSFSALNLPYKEVTEF